MNTIGATIDSINSYLSRKLWCDFRIIELKGHLVIGGRTNLSNTDDIRIEFIDVSYIQCPYEWKTDTSSASFLIPYPDEQFQVNTAYDIEEGYHLVRILAEDLSGDILISSKNVNLTIL